MKSLIITLSVISSLFSYALSASENTPLPAVRLSCKFTYDQEKSRSTPKNWKNNGEFIVEKTGFLRNSNYFSLVSIELPSGTQDSIASLVYTRFIPNTKCNNNTGYCGESYTMNGQYLDNRTNPSLSESTKISMQIITNDGETGKGDFRIYDENDSSLLDVYYHLTNCNIAH